MAEQNPGNERRAKGTSRWTLARDERILNEELIEQSLPSITPSLLSPETSDQRTDQDAVADVYDQPIPLVQVK
jgi:hypothetical protein